MLFNSTTFILFFLPFVLIINFKLNKVNKLYSQYFILISSFFFYSWWNYKLLPLLIFSILFNFWLSKIILKKKNYLYFGILFNLLILIIFKYTNFLIGNLNFFTQSNYDFFELAFPLGLSFYTIQQISYLIDCNEGEIKNIKFIDYSTYVSLFPQLIAGPIVLFRDFYRQKDNILKNSSHYYFHGFFIFMIGLSKKVLIADSLGYFVDDNFNYFDKLSSIESLITSYMFTFQIYFDFSGYTDMALGLGLMLGIRFPNNFNSPYLSRSMIEFWNKWHITLSNFIQIYIYQKIIRRFNDVNLVNSGMVIIFVMFLAGIWHGPTWMYALFGVYHGLGIVINHFWKKYCFALPGFAAWFLTFNFINISFLIFRCNNIETFFAIMKNIVDIKSYFLIFNTNILFQIILLTISAIVIFGFKNSQNIIENPIPVKKIFLISFFSSISLLKIFILNNENAFVYFDF